MALSRMVNSEVGYAIRMYLSSVPTLRASADQRSDFHLLKAEVYELMAASRIRPSQHWIKPTPRGVRPTPSTSTTKPVVW
jgi:hypothetical protein